MEQPRVLEHHAEQLAHIVAIDVAHVDAADADSAALHVVETHEQLDERRLASPRGTHERDSLALFDLRAEILDDDLLGVITELHMIELDVARQVGSIDLGVFLGLFLSLEELEHTLGGSGRHLQHVGHLCELDDGLREVLDVLDERLDVAHRDYALDSEHTAHDGHDDITQIADDVHDRAHEPREELGFPCTLVESLVRVVELVYRCLLTAERLHDRMAAERFLDEAVDGAEVGLLSIKLLLRALDDDADAHDRRGHDKQRDQRHDHVDGEHDGQHAHDGDHSAQQFRNALIEALTQRVDIVGDARERVSRRRALEVTHGQPVDLLGDLAAELVAGLLRNVGEHQALHEHASGAAQVYDERRDENRPDSIEVDAAGALDFGNDAVEQFGRGSRKDLRPDDVEHRRAYGEHQRREHRELETAEETDELAHRALEIARFLRDDHAPRWPARAVTSLLALRRLHELPFLGLIMFAHRPSPPFELSCNTDPVSVASSSGESCE